MAASTLFSVLYLSFLSCPIRVMPSFLGLPLPCLVRDFVEVIGSRLVDIIVDPVAIEVVAVGTPLQQRALGGIVVREIIQRDVDVKALADVSVVLVAKCPMIKNRLPSRDMHSRIPASGDSARIFRSLQAWIALAGTSV